MKNINTHIDCISRHRVQVATRLRETSNVTVWRDAGQHTQQHHRDRDRHARSIHTDHSSDRLRAFTKIATLFCHMPTFECICGYSCGSAKAWARHVERTAGAVESHKLADAGLSALATTQLSKTDMAKTLDAWHASTTHARVESKVIKALEHGATPLINACRRSDLQQVRYLLDAKPSAADLDTCDAAGISAVGWAAKRGHCEILSALLAAGASANSSATVTSPAANPVATEEEGAASEASPPLYLALVRGRADAAALLLSARADPAAVEPVRGQCALHAAVATAELPLDLLEELVRVSPSPLPADLEECTPLHAAAACGQLATLRALTHLLPAFASEARRRSKKGVTPLAAACRRRHEAVAHELVASGAPIDAKAIHLCVAGGSSELLEALRERVRAEPGGAGMGGGVRIDAGGTDDADASDRCFADAAFEDGVTALMMASEAGQVDAVRELLQMRADAAATDADGHTPLMRAAFMGHMKVAALLIEAGACVNAVDGRGASALHHAGRGSQEALFDWLELRHGADAELANCEGELPKVSAQPCRVQ